MLQVFWDVVVDNQPGYVINNEILIDALHRRKVQPEDSLGLWINIDPIVYFKSKIYATN